LFELLRVPVATTPHGRERRRKGRSSSSSGHAPGPPPRRRRSDLPESGGRGAELAVSCSATRPRDLTGAAPWIECPVLWLSKVPYRLFHAFLPAAPPPGKGRSFSFRRFSLPFQVTSSGSLDRRKSRACVVIFGSQRRKVFCLCSVPWRGEPGKWWVSGRRSCDLARKGGIFPSLPVPSPLPCSLINSLSIGALIGPSEGEKNEALVVVRYRPPGPGALAGRYFLATPNPLFDVLGHAH
jgi:hypothetical protein